MGEAIFLGPYARMHDLGFVESHHHYKFADNI